MKKYPIFGSFSAESGSSVTVDAEVSSVSENPVQNKAIAAAITKPNLLIDPDFKINQRGQTEYVKGNKYTVDRWWSNITAKASFKVSVLETGISVSCDAADVIDWNWITQYFEETTFETDTTFTLSVCAKGDFAITYFGDELHNYHSDEFVIKTFTYTVPAGKRFGENRMYLPLIGLSETGTYAEFLWAKLEIGSVATPFVPPDPATELIKCQRYYQIRSTGDISPVDLRPSMRITPTVMQLDNGNYAYNAEI